MEIIKKLFRVTDHALVVYHGSTILGVKHREVSSWLVWSVTKLRWSKAPRADAKGFDALPLAGYVGN